MPDQINSFEHALEADIQSLAQEIEKHRERPENREASGQELIKKAIRSLPPVMTTDAPPAPPKDTDKNPLPTYAQGAPAEVRLEIEYLLDLAFHQGIAKAAAEARKSPDFVQDAFHDALAGRLYPELQRRGILK